MKLIVILCVGVIFSSSCQQIKKDDIAINKLELNYTIKTVVDDLTNPWGMVWLPDGSMLITEKSGTLIHFRNGIKTMVQNVPKVYNRGQGGLLDIELHPDYEENGWIYITYASPEGEKNGGNTAILRAKLEVDKLVQIEYLYKASPNTTRGQHFGSRIEFDNEGYLYFSIGERGDRDKNPQDITRDCGKIYRLNDDGSIPNDNPFVNKKNAKSAIYTFGNRNPQGMALHPETGDLWMHEHGPKGGDELNIVKKGANYGWPTISYGVNYSGTKFTEETTHPDINKKPLIYYHRVVKAAELCSFTRSEEPRAV